MACRSRATPTCSARRSARAAWRASSRRRPPGRAAPGTARRGAAARGRAARGRPRPGAARRGRRRRGAARRGARSRGPRRRGTCSRSPGPAPTGPRTTGCRGPGPATPGPTASGPPRRGTDRESGGTVTMRALLSLPVRARAFVAAVCLGGLAAVAIRIPEMLRWSSLDIPAVAAVALGVAVASHLALGLRHETEIENFDLTDSVLVAGLLLVKPSVLTVAVALGNATGQMSRRWAGHKIAFNVGSNLLAITAAEGVFSVLRSPSATTPMGWLAALAAMAAFFAVNATSVAKVIALVEQRSVLSVIRPGLVLDLVH